MYLCKSDLNETSYHSNGSVDSTSSLEIMSVLNNFASTSFCEKEKVFFSAGALNRLFQGNETNSIM